MAGTGQDHHDWPPGGSAVGTLELQQGGLGSVGGTAAAVCAGAAVARPVGLDAGAVLVGEVDSCVTPHHPLALTASLWCKQCQLHLVLLVVTGSDHAQTALLHHLTATVLIGDPGGQSHATGLRAGAPLCGLLNAVQAGVPTVKPHCFLLTIGRHGEATQSTGLSLGLTHPLLTALPRHLDPAWHGAVRPRQHHVHVAAWHTGDLPIAAHTLVLAGGEEDLAVLIDRTIQNTHISPMSGADPSPLVDVGRVFTLQPFTRVTGVHFRADLSFLTGTHQAAGAVVQDQGHPGETHGGLGRALASTGTHLGPCQCKHLCCEEEEKKSSL